jgi:hypothetical protein
MYKITALRNMRFAETYNKWKGDKEDIRYYKLKYAAQLGEDVERLAFNYYENESIRKHGPLYGAVNKDFQFKLPDKQIL